MRNFKNLIKGFKVDEYELFFSNITTDNVSFKDNELKNIEDTISTGYGVRVIKDKHIGFSATNKYEDIKECMKNAIDSTNSTKRVKFSFPETKEFLNIETADVEWPFEERIRLGNKIVEEISKINQDIRLSVDLVKTKKRVEIFNSSGSELSCDIDSYLIVIFAFGFLKTGVFETFKVFHSLKKPPVDKLNLDSIIMLLKQAEQESVIDKGYYEVILSPIASYALMMTFAPHFDGKNVLKKSSPLYDKLNKKIFDEKLFITDNPLCDLANARPFDEEGVVAKPKKIVEKGVLLDFVNNLDTASELNTNPGNATRRSFKNLPAPSFSNFIISPGGNQFNKLLDSTEKAVYVDLVMGTRYNINGDVSVNIGLGYVIENGKFKGRIKNAMLAGNLYELFSNIKWISSDTEEIGSASIPFICLNNVSIVKK